MEAEIIALNTDTDEVEFLQNFLYDLPLLNKPIPHTSMHYDRLVSLSKVSSKKLNEKKKASKSETQIY